MIAACREFDKKMRNHLVAKMMGTIDEPGSVLLEITTSVLYSSFIVTESSFILYNILPPKLFGRNRKKLYVI